MFTKFAMEGLDTFNLLALRFGLAFILLCIFFYKRLNGIKLKTVLKGSIIGVGYFGVMTLELTSLKYTSTSTTSFLENTAIVLVPIFEGVLRKKFPDKNIVVACTIAIIGVGILTLGGSFGLGTGEILAMIGATVYASTIIFTDRVAKNDDSLVIGIFQIGFLGFFSAVSTFIFESPTLPSSSLEWISLGVLILVCTGFGFTLQPVAQRYLSSEKTGLYCALNPAFASVFGFIFLKESFAVNSIIGDALILFSIIIASVMSNKKESQLSQSELSQLDGIDSSTF